MGFGFQIQPTSLIFQTFPFRAHALRLSGAFLRDSAQKVHDSPRKPRHLPGTWDML